MKILGLKIPFTSTANKAAVKSRITHEDIKQKAKRIESKIRRQTLSRIKINITNWLHARIQAESLTHPSNTELVRVMRDISIDAHLWALMQTLRLKVISNSFEVYNSEGELDEDSTKKFKKKWFRDITKFVVDSEFFGFSLVQLGGIQDGCYTGATIVPREYVVQQSDGVKRSQGNSADLIPFNKGVYKRWLIPIGEKDNLGLLDKAAPLVIKKKEVVTAWSEAAELFGQPLRVGKTSIQDDERREYMEDMLENIGGSAWAVIDDEDDIEFKDTSKTDFSNMYDKFIERVNSELSKLFLSQTGTTDEKAHVGSAKVMDNVLKDVVQSYILKVEDVANEQVIPMMQREGLIPFGAYLKASEEQKLTLLELWNIVKELRATVTISDQWVSTTFGIPIEEVQAGENVDEKAQAELRGSVGGVEALVLLVKSVSEGLMSVESAIAVVEKVYGIPHDEAKVMVGQPKPAPKEEKPVASASVLEKVANMYKGSLKECC